MYLAEYLLSIREFLEEYPTGENVSNENTAGQRLSYGLLPEKGQAEKILSYGFSERPSLRGPFPALTRRGRRRRSGYGRAEPGRPAWERVFCCSWRWGRCFVRMGTGNLLREILWRWERRFTGMCPEALRRATSQILKGQLTGKRNILYIPSANC